MKKQIMIGMMIVMLSGCVSTYWEEDKTYVPTTHGTTNLLCSVHVGQKAFWIKSDISNLRIPYHGDTITLGAYSTKGDDELMKELAMGITYGLIAYSSMGSVPAMEAILKAIQSGEAKEVIEKYQKGEIVTKEDMPIASSYIPAKNKGAK